MAVLSVRDQEVALDMVQEAMIKLTKNYRHKPQKEWPPLFYRILQNCIRDWQRQQMVRNKVMVWSTSMTFKRSKVDDSQYSHDTIDQAPDRSIPSPERSLMTDHTMHALTRAVSGLSTRQREVFLLRAVEQLSIADTAKCLKVSQGSIKTHYSRAIALLREKLGDHWP